MTLVGVRGNRKSVDSALLLHATRQPTLFLDCANCADPHRLFGIVSMDDLFNVHVLQAEVLYKFRDTIKRLSEFAGSVNTDTIIVSTFSGLFAFQDEEENERIYEHAWELLSGLGLEHTVFVGVHENEVQQRFAEKFCDEVVEEDGLQEYLEKMTEQCMTISVQQ